MLNPQVNLTITENDVDPQGPPLVARFRFRLEAVRALREQTQQQAQHELARELAAREEQIQALDAATRDVERARDGGRPARGLASTAHDLVQRQAFVERTERTRHAAHEDLAAQEQAVADSRAHLQQASQDREVLERLKRDRLAAHRQAQARQEVAALDEIAMRPVRPPGRPGGGMSLQTAVARVDELMAQLGVAPADQAAAATQTSGTETTDGTSFQDTLDQASAPSTDAALPAEAAKFKPMIDRAARYWGVDPDVITAVIEHESRFNPNATNPTSGAMGLMQLMPATAKGLGVQNPYDPAQNIWGGAHVLSTQLQHFHGDLRLALAAYSAGASTVEKYGGVPPYAETTQFVSWMMNRVQELEGARG